MLEDPSASIHQKVTELAPMPLYCPLEVHVQHHIQSYQITEVVLVTRMHLQMNYTGCKISCMVKRNLEKKSRTFDRIPNIM